MSIDDDAETEIVGASRVARRALVLAASACRGNIESGAGDPEAILLRERILDWAALVKLEEEWEHEERRILRAIAPSWMICDK